MRLRRKYTGLNTNRLASNRLEAQFTAAWQRQNEAASPPGTERADTLDYILHQGDQRFPKLCSERDREVANTVIQWLGSPVGQSFVEGVLAGEEGVSHTVDPIEIHIVD